MKKMVEGGKEAISQEEGSRVADGRWAQAGAWREDAANYSVLSRSGAEIGVPGSGEAASGIGSQMESRDRLLLSLLTWVRSCGCGLWLIHHAQAAGISTGCLLLPTSDPGPCQGTSPQKHEMLQCTLRLAGLSVGGFSHMLE